LSEQLHRVIGDSHDGRAQAFLGATTTFMGQEDNLSATTDHRPLREEPVVRGASATGHVVLPG
jgi:hypothetical protein